MLLNLIMIIESVIMDQSTTYFIYFLAAIGGIVFVIWISKIIWALIILILPNKNYQ